MAVVVVVVVDVDGRWSMLVTLWRLTDTPSRSRQRASRRSLDSRESGRRFSWCRSWPMRTSTTSRARRPEAQRSSRMTQANLDSGEENQSDSVPFIYLCDKYLKIVFFFLSQSMNNFREEKILEK